MAKSMFGREEAPQDTGSVVQPGEANVTLSLEDRVSRLEYRQERFEEMVREKVHGIPPVLIPDDFIV